MTTWITKLDAPGDGLRVAVKDAIDVAGVPTTVGCRALADGAKPAERDADCVVGARAAGARIVGKANLHELCFGTTGLNPVFGNPVNPRWPDRVPGGSSSGSAAAVGFGEADVAFGTDTGGSVRLPAACCGLVGLKTTWDRISLRGVWPLAPSLDTVGPLARDVAGVVLGMSLLEPGFSVAGVAPATVVGRLRPSHVSVNPAFDEAVDAALAAAELEIVDAALDGWVRARDAFGVIIGAEAWESDGHLLRVEGGVAEPVRSRLAPCASIHPEAVAAARATQASWTTDLNALLSRVEVLALPTLFVEPAPLDDPSVPNDLCQPFNLAGVPAISIPLPGPPGSSLQLVGAPGAEDLLCATAARVEAALA